MNDLNEQKQILSKEYEKNCERIDELTERIRTINANSFELRALSVIGFSLLPWFILLLLTPAIVNLGIIPLSLIQPLSIGIPVLIGLAGEMAISKKYECKERLKKFSKAKRQKEKIEEETRYEIEKEQLLNANKIIANVYDMLETKQSCISSLMQDYDIKLKVEEGRTSNVLGLKVDNLKEVLDSKVDKVNVLSTKLILLKKFWRFREMYQRVTEAIFGVIFGGMFAMALVSLPIMAINMTGALVTANVFNVISSLLIGCLVGGVYNVKKAFDNRKVFNIINQELGEYALDSSSIDSERKRKMGDSAEVDVACELEESINSATKTRYDLDQEKLRLKQILALNEKMCETPKMEVSEQLENEENLTTSELEEKGPRLIRK